MDLQCKDDDLLIIGQYPEANLSTKYHFFYDDTNNIRKFYLKDNRFNSNCLDNFVLGGIVFEEVQYFDEQFISSLKLQNNTEEIKFKNIAHGKFLDCLKSENLMKFLEYLNSKDIYVHYSSFNLLYWSLIDIVESAEENCDSNNIYEYDKEMKNTLYSVVKQNQKQFINLFIKYSYPNIKQEDIQSFIKELVSSFYKYISDPEMHFDLQMLKGLLELAIENNRLLFLSAEEDYVLLKDFLQEYLRPIGLFSNSVHIFDEEAFIMGKMKDIRILKGSRELKNFSFVDSTKERWIQMSDVFVGLIGRLKMYLNKNSFSEIEESLSTLNNRQKNNLRLLSKLLNKSENKNIIFFHNIDSSSEMEKMGLIMNFT